jgi:4-amino-4-deoxy-L-arabinose transferase-like glycosyltransferase
VNTGIKHAFSDGRFSFKPHQGDVPSVQYKTFLLVLLLASFFRIWGTFEFPGYIEDEAVHVPNAVSLGQYGTTDRLNWQHPHLSGLILSGTISLFGDNPYGWRTGNVLFGIGSVVLVYMIGALAYPGSAVPLLASLLLALDPFHVYFSRTTYMEIPVTFFFLLFLYFILEFVERQRPTLPLAGIALGLTVATKAYFVFSIPLVLAYVLLRARERGELTRARYMDFAATLLVLPLAVYLLSYFKWFGRGYALSEFFQLKMDALWALQRFNAEGFVNRRFLEAGGQPWEWFLKPFIIGHQVFSDGVQGRFLLHINNPPFGLLVIPAMLLLTARAILKRAVKDLLVPLLFLSCYLLFLLVQRPIFSHSALVVLPFAYLAVARAVDLFAASTARGKWIYSLFLTGVLAWGFYTFPLISARLVPLSLFRPILSIAEIDGQF